MNILHITCGFPYSSVYNELFRKQRENYLNIQVYVPLHAYTDTRVLEKSKFPYAIYWSKVIYKIDKLLYFTKIFRMKKNVIRNFKLTNIDIIHAHSLFSDGGVAYELYKLYKKPYIVAVRDTDLNKYFRLAKHLKPYALKILFNASNIVFISETYKQSLINNYIPPNKKEMIEKKSIVIPNGINEFWLNNVYKTKPKFTNDKNVIKLIFIGKILKRKNIETLIAISNKLNQEQRRKFELHIVGEIADVNYFNNLKEIGPFRHIGHCPKEDLIEYYRKNDIFVMLSLTETFGLVYAEAMSQGLPVIYTKGQGFDGQFENGSVGYSVLPFDIEEASKSVLKILNNYDDISNKCLKSVHRYDWGSIFDEYQMVYKGILKKKI